MTVEGCLEPAGTVCVSCKEKLKILNIRRRCPITPGAPVQRPSSHPAPEIVDSPGVCENTRVWYCGCHGHVEEPLAVRDACGICRKLPKDVGRITWGEILPAPSASSTGEDCSISSGTGGIWLSEKSGTGCVLAPRLQPASYLDRRDSRWKLMTVEMDYNKIPR